VVSFEGAVTVNVNQRILVVDDERNILLTLSQALALESYQVDTALNAASALDLLQSKPVDAVLMDIKMPDMDGLTALQKIASLSPRLPVIMMSGHGSIETAVRATQLGARDFLEKPISRDRLLLALKNALEHQRMVDELASLRAEVGRFDMAGTSPAMTRIFSLVQRSAPSDGRVLITGENGSGKELIARAIHAHSKRAKMPFVKLNCAAVPHELIESELFGHEKGAFTGAYAARRGKFELAHNGTLFLDEIGDMPPAMQAKLLRVLQEGELERVGASETISVDVRVLAATNKDLEQEIALGRFREDLFFRLNVLQIHAPALRERREDIPLLLNLFLDEACRKNDRKQLAISSEASAVIAGLEFPGNVRELKNMAERIAILCEGPVVKLDALGVVLPRKRPPVFASTPVPVAAPALVGRFRHDKSFREQVEDAEREILLGALSHTKDNAAEAARLLDLERGHFYKKLKGLGLRRAGGETQVAAAEESISSASLEAQTPAAAE
jgi:two-component system, NtrC family, nitrogen regulation response regulator NtrX